MLITNFILTLISLAFIASASSPSLATILILSMVMGTLACTNYLKNWTHVLLMLLTLEIFMLSSALLLGTLISFSSFSPETIFVFFTLAVCEATLGLSVLVCYTRYFGKDFLVSSSSV